MEKAKRAIGTIVDTAAPEQVGREPISPKLRRPILFRLASANTDLADLELKPANTDLESDFEIIADVLTRDSEGKINVYRQGERFYIGTSMLKLEVRADDLADDRAYIYRRLQEELIKNIYEMARVGHSKLASEIKAWNYLNSIVDSDPVETELVSPEPLGLGDNIYRLRQSLAVAALFVLGCALSYFAEEAQGAPEVEETVSMSSDLEDIAHIISLDVVGVAASQAEAAARWEESYVSPTFVDGNIEVTKCSLPRP